MSLTVAALQYCASDDAATTLAHIEPLIAKAAKTAHLICLPEAASFLAASRATRERAEWEDDSASQKSWRHWHVSIKSGCWLGHCFCGGIKIINWLTGVCFLPLRGRLSPATIKFICLMPMSGMDNVIAVRELCRWHHPCNCLSW